MYLCSVALPKNLPSNSLTLFGRHRFRDAVVWGRSGFGRCGCWRGSSGPFVGAAHQVHHNPECAEGSELEIEMAGASWRFAVSTMNRSEYFPEGAFNRLRCRKGSPTETWDMFSRVLHAWLPDEITSGSLRLPTEAECLLVQRERQTA